MACPAGEALFASYAKAAMEHFEATEKLSGLVGEHGPFNEQKKYQKKHARNAVRLG
jgi:hypothetical protein